MPKAIIGIDEVGTGAWAGPLAVCAFWAPDESWDMSGLNDSKQVTKKLRGSLSNLLRALNPGKYEIEWASSVEIDEVGLAEAHHKAIERAAWRLIARLGVPDRVIIDGDKQHIQGAECYPRADGTYPAVMAASVIAKVARDNLMAEMSLKYPEYKFEKNVGYGTDHHLAAIKRIGLTPIHRTRFRPMIDFVRKS